MLTLLYEIVNIANKKEELIEEAGLIIVCTEEYSREYIAQLNSDGSHL